MAAVTTERTHEREITEAVDLCRPDGGLNPAAIGWSRRPLHRANLRGRGRAKRWEYWCVTSPTHVLGVTVSDLDYAALHAVWFLGPDRSEVAASALVPFSRVGLPDRCGAGPVLVRAKGLSIDLLPDEGGLTLQATTPSLKADVRIDRPPGHEALGVVVPWSGRLFQYTVKENTLPARGRVAVGGREHAFGEDSWGTLDHGRGRWPYRIDWNWGSGSGRVDGRVVGLQVGGAWTDGTGSTENALTVDGRLHKLGEELLWSYDRADWMRPWRVEAPRTGRADLTFTPYHVRSDRIERVIIGNDTHQAFGHWSGWVADDSGERISVDGLHGWAEEVRNRW